jgi:hypothetical protein
MPSDEIRNDRQKINLQQKGLNGDVRKEEFWPGIGQCRDTDGLDQDCEQLNAIGCDQECSVEFLPVHSAAVRCIEACWRGRHSDKKQTKSDPAYTGIKVSGVDEGKSKVKTSQVSTLIAEAKNLNVIKENSLEESQEAPGSPGLPISTPVGDNGSLGSSYEGVIVESKEPKPEYKESQPEWIREEKDKSAGDEEGKMIDPWVGLLTLKEKIKTHTEDPIENTINQFLNHNLDETELDYILKIKTSDAY